MSKIPAAHGIMFHHFHGGAHRPSQGSISADEFRNLIAALGTDRILSPDEWMAKHATGTLPTDAICLTFDDGLRSQIEIALPVLKQLNLKAFWFVYSSVFFGESELLETCRFFRHRHFTTVAAYISAFSKLAEDRHPAEISKASRSFNPDTYLAAFPFYTRADRWYRFLRDEILGAARYEALVYAMFESFGFNPAEHRDDLWVREDDLRELSHDGHAIGLHSYSHPTRMADLPLEKQILEYQTNYDHIRAVVGVPPLAASHPVGSYGRDTLDVLRGLGIQIAFCSSLDAPSPNRDLEWPREDHANLMSRLSTID